MEHEHMHTHADGTTHSHPHDHEHEHEHMHEHEHSHEHPHVHEGEDENVVMLRYLLDHFQHHVSEISELAESLPEDHKAEVLQACEVYDQANALLQSALEDL